MSQHGKYPKLAINDGRDGFRDLTLPRVVEGKEIGRKLPNGVILDVVPSGAQLIVLAVIFDSSPNGVNVWLECELFYANKRLPRVSTLFIQASVDGRRGRLPEIDQTLAVRVK